MTSACWLLERLTQRNWVRWRKMVGDMPLLVPGVGAQGGDVEAVLRAGVDSRGQGLCISSSRASFTLGRAVTSPTKLGKQPNSCETRLTVIVNRRLACAKR